MRFWVLLSLVTSLLAVVDPPNAKAAWIPDPTGPVIDRYSVLTKTTRDFLSELLRVHEDETSNEMVVITFLRESDLSDDGTSVEAFSNQLVRDWKLGKEGQGNGVVLVVLTKDRLASIGVGDGLAAVMTETKVRTIVDQYVMPSVRAGNFDDGIRQGVIETMNVLSGYEIGHVAEPVTHHWTWAMIVVAIILLTILSVMRRGWTDYEKLSRNYSRERQRISAWGGGGADFKTPLNFVTPGDNSGGDVEKPRRNRD